MPRKTLALITGLVVITVILFVVALGAGKQTKYSSLREECQSYGNLPLESVPAKCVQFFK